VDELVLVGIDGGGQQVARNLSALLQEISPLNIVTIPLKINKKKPMASTAPLGMDLNGRTVVFVDDVVNSGRTIFYALGAVSGFDLKRLMIAVLVDRKHKSFPVASDIVGHTVATTLQEHIEVEISGDEIVAVYLE